MMHNDREIQKRTVMGQGVRWEQKTTAGSKKGRPKVLMLASVASMIDQFNLPNLKLMQQMGYEVHVVCNFQAGNTCDAKQLRRFQKKLREMHMFQHQWDCPRDIRFVKKCWIAYRQLQRLLQKYRFAWMHCHSPIGGAIARMVAHQANVPVVYTAHGFHFYEGAPFKNWLFYYPIEKLLAHWTDVLITINKEDYRLAKKKMKAGKICYTPGVGIDTERFQKLRIVHDDSYDRENTQRLLEHKKFCQKYQIPENASILLSVGELSRRKNHQVVIDALARISKEDVYYFICGQGELDEKLMLYAQKLRVACQIRMTGFQENVDELYKNADIFVFPSLQEGMPAALMEAMAAGLPCVVSDIRGNRELIAWKEPYNGLTYTKAFAKRAGGMRFLLTQPKQMDAALLLLLEDAQLRQICGLRCKEKIQSYDWNIIQQQMRKIYADMDASHRHSNRFRHAKTT